MRARPRHLLAAIAALVGIGAAQASAPAGVPAPSKEYIGAPRQTRRRRKKQKRPPLPMHSGHFKGPSPAPGSTNFYGLLALSPGRMDSVPFEKRPKVHGAFVGALHILSRSKGSQAVLRAERNARRAA